MSVLIYIDHAEGQIKKSALEAISYGSTLSKKLNTTAEGLILGNTKDDLAALGNYGLSTVHQATAAGFDSADSQALVQAISTAAGQLNAEVIVFAANATGIALAPRTAVRLNAGLVSFALALPSLENGFTVKKVVFSGKAFAHVKVNTPVKVITLTGNSYPIEKSEGTAAINTLDLTPTTNKVNITDVHKVEGEVSLTEAEIVVSGGRGLKGPENWNLVTDLAHALHGAIACSRPVADDGWRPHHEHVGQTGIQIAPNLYIAIGISGAIQHLGGVNRSKTIVVINKDPEAPFFKAADYGIVGDAFEVVPRLTEAVKALKG